MVALLPRFVFSFGCVFFFNLIGDPCRVEGWEDSGGARWFTWRPSPVSRGNSTEEAAPFPLLGP